MDSAAPKDINSKQLGKKEDGPMTCYANFATQHQTHQNIFVKTARHLCSLGSDG